MKLLRILYVLFAPTIILLEAKVDGLQWKVLFPPEPKLNTNLTVLFEGSSQTPMLKRTHFGQYF